MQDVFLEKVKKYFPHILMAALLGRILIVGAGIGDAITAVGLLGLCGYYKFVEGESDKWRTVVSKEIEDVKQFISSFRLQMKMTGQDTNERPKQSSIRRF